MKKKLIYSLYIDIPPNEIDEQKPYAWDTINKSERTRLQLKKYAEKLEAAQIEYAKAIGADYILFRDDKEYREFYDWLHKLQPTMSHYDILNFYKIWLFVETAKKYEKVLYLDFDVIPNTTKDFFDVWNVEDSVCLADSKEDARFNLMIGRMETHDNRNPISKYWNAHAMLTYREYETLDVKAWNTAIMGGTTNSIANLHYFDDFENLMEYMKELQDDEYSMYPIDIRQNFGFDNETVFGYRVVENNVPITLLDYYWHARVLDEDEELDPDVKLYHMINKRFDMYWPDE